MAFIKRVERSKPWLAVYQDGDGREHSKAFLRKGDAERFLVSKQGEVHRGDWVDPAFTRTTVRVWAERWLATRKDLAAYDRDESYVRNHVIGELGDRTLGSLRPIELEEWIVTLKDKGLAPSTIAKIRGLFHTMLKAAVKSGYLARNPMADVETVTVGDSEQRFLSIAEVEALADAIDPRYRLMILIGAYCGLRFGEVLALRVGDFDLADSTVSVSGTMRKRSGVGWYRHPGTKSKAGLRTVTIPASLLTEVAVHIDGKMGFAFPAPEGGPVNGDNWRRRIWRPAVMASVGEPCRFHHLRHSQASLAVGLSGVHPKLMAARLGHSSTRVTERYSHAGADLDARLAGLIDELRVASLTEQGRNKPFPGVVPLKGRREKRGADQGVR